MRMWYIILMVTILMTMVGFLYLGHQVGKFQIVQQLSYQGAKLKINSGYFIVLITFCLLWWALNLMNAVVCLFYFAIIWLACDLAFVVIALLGGLQFQTYYAGVCAIILSTASLSLGWYQAHNIWQTEYTVYTNKDVSPLKIAFSQIPISAQLLTALNLPNISKKSTKMPRMRYLLSAILSMTAHQRRI